MNLSAAPTPGAIGALRPLASGSVTLRGGLLGERAAINTAVSLPHGYAMLGQRGALDYLRRAARASGGRWPPPPVRDGHVEKIYDSDIYKWLEAVAWSWPGVTEPVAAGYDDVVRLLEAARRPDGYLHSWTQVNDPGGGLRNWANGGEPYCWGHLIQAGIAGQRSAGREDLLGIAAGVADYLVRSDARAPDGTPVVPSHPGIETALAELYRTTGKGDYLELAGTFLDRRGYGSIGGWAYGPRYFRDDVPVRSARTASGHAVMALYLMAGMIDVAVETGDAELLEAASAQWADMVARRMYLTGGVGSRHYEEGFGDGFELPPDRAYCETCAAVAAVMAGWRLQLATGDERIADVIERVIFNALLVGVSLAGDTFSYVNPLHVRPGHLGGVNETAGTPRAPWFECACCPPNLMRLLATIGECVASTSADGVHLHQYASATIEAPYDDGYQRSLEVTTGYPWSGSVTIDVTSGGQREWELVARVPSWSPSARVEVRSGGVVQSFAADGSGVIRIRRRWSRETVAVTFGLRPRAVIADRRLDAVRDCVAYQRGPVVYCLERPPGTADLVAVSPDGSAEEREVDLAVPSVTGMSATELEVQGWEFTGEDDDWPYRELGSESGGRWRPIRPVLVPYFAWGNGDARAMRVWLPVRHEADRG